MFPSQNNEIPSSAKTGLKTPYYTTPVLLWRKPRDFYKYIVNSLISNCCLQLDSQPIRSEKWLGCSFILPVYVVGQIGPLFEFNLVLNPRLLLLIKLLHKSLWFCFHETQLGPLYFLLSYDLRLFNKGGQLGWKSFEMFLSKTFFGSDVSLFTSWFQNQLCSVSLVAV